MEFPGGCTTNIRTINGFSNIHWRIYTEEPGVPSTGQSETPNNHYAAFTHYGRLKEAELQLRSLDCLVTCYPRWRGLWIFSGTPDFESLSSLHPSENGSEIRNKITVNSTTLKLSASGRVTSVELIEGLSDPQSSNVNSAGSQKPANAPNPPNPPKRTLTYGGYAAVYASFISAILGYINLQFVRRHGAIPLGSRTLFTAVDKDYFESARILNESPISTPSLTNLQVQLTPVGKLILSLQTVTQNGLSRLYEPEDPIQKTLDTEPGIDLWLAPNGSIARLVTAKVDSQDISSPRSSSGEDGLREGPVDQLAIKRNQWKLDVAEWLGKFGLLIEYIEKETWVEVEVCEPLFFRMAGETPSALPLERILWPARFCFKRVTTSASHNLQDFPLSSVSALDYAEWWFNISYGREDVLFANPPDQQPPQPKQRESSPPREDAPGEIVSLARAAEYPDLHDLQAASLMYPTPPDGAPAVGTNNMNTLNASLDGSEVDHSQTNNSNQHEPDKVPSAEEHSSANPTIGFGPAAGLTVGSGLYDTSGDDDLFGELGSKDFGTKGITDADFSFFDDPEFGVVKGAGDAQGPPKSTSEAEEVQPSVHEPRPENTVARDPGSSAVRVDSRPSELDPHGAPENVQGNDKRPPATAPSPPDTNNQIISPPLSPKGVKRILLPPEADQSNHSATNRSRRQSHYQPVSFKPESTDWEQKYGAHGKFGFAPANMNAVAGHPSDSAIGIPTIGFPRRRKKVSGALGASKHSTNNEGNLVNELHSLSVSSDDDSDSSDAMSIQPNQSFATFANQKRKRSVSNPDEPKISSPEKTPAFSDQYSALCKADNLAFLGSFVSLSSDWPLIGYFSVSPDPSLPILPGKECYVEVAQILIDQVTQSSLNHRLGQGPGASGLENDSFPLLTFLEEPSFISKIDKLDLRDYATLQDSALKLKGSRKSSISKLPFPHLRIRRGQDYLEVLPSAIPFWETFGLEPVNDPIDISAYCIHPHVATEAADAFLERLGLLYSSCGLGRHARGEDSEAFRHGLGSWNINLSDPSGYSSLVQSLRALCESLGTALLESQSAENVTVVYIINPFNHAAALADICAAFWQLVQVYVDNFDDQRTDDMNEIVLQIIPWGFVASADYIVTPTQAEYLNLALEVYSRCASQAESFDTAPPILLAEPVPKAINFRLAPDKTSPFLEGRILHLAYSRNLDPRWVTVAWSDNTGSFQRSMTYCLQFRNVRVARNTSEVRVDIWKTTMSIMETLQTRKLVLAYTEPVDQDEVDAWVNLYEQYNTAQPSTIEFILLSINTVSDLYLEPPALPMPINAFAHMSFTPVTTPNPSGAVPSPERSGNAATPSSANPATPTEAPPETDPDSLVIDICDESWSVILSHQLNTSPNLTEFKPALASGYLLRRKGSTDGDGATVMAVNLIYTQRPPSSYEALLNEILGKYRDLASLARAKGTHMAQQNTLPWHIATAVRGQELLSYAL